MKLISWNVNGLRACMSKGFPDFFAESNPDILCLQETKLQPDQITWDTPEHHQYWNSAVKKGYSGTAVFTKQQPLTVTYGLGIEAHDQEGRVITCEYPDFYLVTVYTPNSQRGLTRLDYRMEWDDAFRAYLIALDAKKPVIVCGDLNVAHREIDLKNPKSNTQSAGFTPEEREKMTQLLDSGFTDTFRFVHGDVPGIYSWWSYMYHARENNAGWRIDYFLVSRRLESAISSAEILTQVMGSDHCPVVLELDEVKLKEIN